MNLTSSDEKAQAAPEEGRVFHGEVVGIVAQTWHEPVGYRVQVEACGATLYVTLPEAVPLWTPFDLVLKPAPRIESES